jgi:hypothetical protein
VLINEKRKNDIVCRVGWIVRRFLHFGQDDGIGLGAWASIYTTDSSYSINDI